MWYVLGGCLIFVFIIVYFCVFILYVKKDKQKPPMVVYENVLLYDILMKAKISFEIVDNKIIVNEISFCFSDIISLQDAMSRLLLSAIEKVKGTNEI